MWARARDQQLALPERTSGRSALAWRPAGRALLSHKDTRPVKLAPRGGRRSDQLQSANFSMVPTAPTRTPCRGVNRGRGRRTRRRHQARRSRWIPTPPRDACSRYLSRAAEPWTFMFPSSLARAKDQPQLLQRPEGQPPSCQGSASPPLRRQIEEEQPPSWQAPSVQPPSRARGPPDEEIWGALQNVSCRLWSLHHGPFSLF
jgi:hypothetical protein